MTVAVVEAPVAHRVQVWLGEVAILEQITRTEAATARAIGYLQQQFRYRPVTCVPLTAAELAALTPWPGERS
ncbi:hypothetical protein ACFV9C_42080 [Kribbella sp. NPDC059898]|uniref:hypothetical protein n=1 Tax=Kribbella sp. NPDC059898 TaxID=3346995 RepID=UPI0036578B41